MRSSSYAEDTCNGSRAEKYESIADVFGFDFGECRGKNTREAGGENMLACISHEFGENK